MDALATSAPAVYLGIRATPITGCSLLNLELNEKDCCCSWRLNCPSITKKEPLFSRLYCAYLDIFMTENVETYG